MENFEMDNSGLQTIDFHRFQCVCFFINKWLFFSVNYLRWINVYNTIIDICLFYYISYWLFFTQNYFKGLSWYQISSLYYLNTIKIMITMYMAMFVVFSDIIIPDYVYQIDPV